MLTYLFLQDPVDPSDVKAGGWAFILLLVMIVALVILMFSFARHIRKARQPWGDDDNETDQRAE